MNENTKIIVELTKDELELIYKEFSDLTNVHLHKWNKLVEAKQYKTKECDEQWLLTGIYQEVTCQIGEALGIQVSNPIDELDEEVRIIPFEAYKNFIQNK